jgi:Bardet-Biedl syndrome 7 protein
VYEAEIAGPPTTLSLNNRTGGRSGCELLYGTSDGKVGLIEIGVDEPTPKWELPNEKKLGGVCGIDSYDITSDGVLDLLVCREDGSVEVYVYDDIDNPTLKYNYVRSFFFSSFYFYFLLF